MDEAGVRWSTWPRLRDMARLYPVRARVMDVRRGWAEVSCTPDPRGKLSCVATDEYPKGRFFGDAAVKVMRGARVAAVDGGSPEGRTFSYRLRFGNWPPERLDDKWHPVEAGLRWTERPRLSGEWDLGRTAKNRTYAIPLSCVAQADGSVSCTPKSDAGVHPRLLRAALDSVGAAKVTRVSGASPEGVRFDYTMSFVRTSNCNAGGDRLDATASGPDQSLASTSVVEFRGTAAEGSASGVRVRGAPGCKPTLLQLR